MELTIIENKFIRQNVGLFVTVVQMVETFTQRICVLDNFIKVVTRWTLKWHATTPPWLNEKISLVWFLSLYFAFFFIFKLWARNNGNYYHLLYLLEMWFEFQLFLCPWIALLFVFLTIVLCCLFWNSVNLLYEFCLYYICDIKYTIVYSCFKCPKCVSLLIV